MSRHSLSLLLTLLLSGLLTGQTPRTAGIPALPTATPGESLRNTRWILLRADPEDRFTRIGPPVALSPSGPRTATIQVEYRGFPQEARAAFQYAVDIWEQTIASTVPVRIIANWVSLDAGVLGSCGARSYSRNFPNAPLADTWYCIALAEQLAGLALNPPDSADIVANFNRDFPNFYFGTDGNTPAGMYDFPSIVLHEICHGLGFTGSMTVHQGMGSWGFGTGFPLVFDHFAVNGNGYPLLDTARFPNPSAALAGELTGGAVFFNGPEAVAANGDAPPPLYAPPIWQQGSSYSHLDEATYPAGNPNSLMTPSIGMAESIHNPGDIVRGVFSDIGWSISGGGGGTIRFEESFASTTVPPGWVVVDNDGSALMIDLYQRITFSDGGEVNPQAGQAFWFSNFQNADFFTGLIDEWVITPRIDNIATGDSLVFWAGAMDVGYDDSLRVFVSTTGNTLPDFRYRIAYFKVDGPVGCWHRYGFDLSPFAGHDIHIAINYYIVDGGLWGTHSDNVWVDHVMVKGQPLTAVPPRIAHSDPVPGDFRLEQNRPNPFNPATRITYSIPGNGHVRLTVHDLLGRTVGVLVDRPQAAGRYGVVFDGAGLPSGVYLYRLTAGGTAQTRRMLLIR